MPPKRRQPKPKTMIHHALFGRRISPSEVPRPIVYNPWNSLTVVTQHTIESAGVAEQLTSGLVISALRFQLGLPSIMEISIRFRSVSVWVGQAVQPVALNAGVVIYSILRSPSVDSPPDAPELAHFECFSSGLRPVRFGYEWPTSQQVIPLSSDNSGINLYSLVVNKNHAPVQVHINVLWRPSDTSSIPSLLCRLAAPSSFEVLPS